MESQKQLELVGSEVLVKSKREICITMPMAGQYAVDWKGQPVCQGKHGGIKAAIFILGLQAFEIMAIAAVGNNLITYVFNDMHYTLARSANIVTNFVGTTFLLSLLGGFLSDSYLGSIWTIIVFGCVELTGYVVIAVQAHVPRLKPSSCNMLSEAMTCKQPKGLEAFVLFLGLYLIAVGSGCVKPNIISHGGDQFDGNDSRERRQMSSYFNLAYLSFSIGELIALTFIVWIQNHWGRDVGFGVSAAVMLLALLSITAGIPFYRNKIPQGSVFTRIAHVLVAAVHKRKLKHPPNPDMLYEITENTDQLLQKAKGARQLLHHTDQFRFLDKAAIVETEDAHDQQSTPSKLCTVTEVEQVKLIVRVMPIFGCTIIMNCILAQLQTFSVQQGSVMDTRITDNFHIPPASVQAIPFIMMVILVPFYDTVFVPMARSMTGNETGITQLQRIGIGLFSSTLSMVTAALVEAKRKAVAIENLSDHHNQSALPISIFWIAPQFLIFGFSEMFSAVGLIEFFYSQSPAGMQSLLTALTYCSYSFGFFLSSVLVSTINKITTNTHHGGWLSFNDLNKDRLDLFYWLLSALGLINFLNYMFWARWYNYNLPFLSRTLSQMEYNTSKSTNTHADV